MTDGRAVPQSERSIFVDALLPGQTHNQLHFLSAAARLDQSAKLTNLEEHPATHNSSCQDPGLLRDADVTNAPCKSVPQHPVDFQQQGHGESQPHSVWTDLSTSLLMLRNVTEWIPGVCSELQPAATQQHANKATPGRYLLGVLVTVVDNVASDSVFGPDGIAGRPEGMMHLSVIDNVHSAKLLSRVCEERWLAFLEIWQNAGWSPTSLVDFVSTLRPLQYRSDLDGAFICSVTRDYLHD